ncbi:MAG TPA: sulfur carrier protein ThiS [Bryobacteraceae bacterium]|nr:sulfur carrier protein ThiS [Bryobacteraceae bacterium]
MADPAPETIRVVVNGQSRSVATGQTVLGLLRSLGLDPSRLAIELNGRIVRQTEWAATPLEAGAQLEIVHFVGGG